MRDGTQNPPRRALAQATAWAYRLSAVPEINKILFATDFSDDSINAQRFAEELARKFNSEIIVLHVDQPLAPVMVSELGPAFDVSAMNQIAEEQRLGAQREIDKIVTQLRDAQIKARSLLRVGAPFLEIIHAAQTENADLIVRIPAGARAPVEHTVTFAQPVDRERATARWASGMLTVVLPKLPGRRVKVQ